jgi:CRISPR/Cas system-associated endonuclease Cas3-HD
MRFDGSHQEGDTKLKKKLVFIDVENESQKRVLKKAIKRYKDMEAWFQEMRDPNP